MTMSFSGLTVDTDVTSMDTELQISPNAFSNSLLLNLFLITSAYTVLQLSWLMLPL